MQNESPQLIAEERPDQGAPPPVLRTPGVRAYFNAHWPEYGREFGTPDWERIAERLQGLTRLLWRIASRPTDRSGVHGLAELRDPRQHTSGQE